MKNRTSHLGYSDKQQPRLQNSGRTKHSNRPIISLALPVLFLTTISLSACTDQPTTHHAEETDAQIGPAQADPASNSDFAQVEHEKAVTAPIEQLHYDVQFSATVPACLYPSDVDKAINLMNSGNIDLVAPETSCVFMAEGTKAVGIDYLGSHLREVLIQDEKGRRQKLWTVALAVDPI
ncbi:MULTISPECIES: hypothetical protein [Asticcacaulis]|uniref:hypothetical protein n=1 Tax=Asticcacaulis TaxID=76890 RepID=UPI001AE7947D|nr:MULTISPECIES: hypothetical protein [Asticcacaulis]MBP2157489.1 hypothetical protein [Asticcacaulis solisilvae]MDR6798534.1 hypothetical protein [Asticcacaulis sp. BE141]